MVGAAWATGGVGPLRAPRLAPWNTREKNPGLGDGLVRPWGVPVGPVVGVGGDCLSLVSAWQLHGVHMVSTWGCISEVSHHLQHSGAYAPASIQYVPFYYLMLHTFK